jgi:hypothetical protein
MRDGRALAKRVSLSTPRAPRVGDGAFKLSGELLKKRRRSFHGRQVS